MTNERAFRGVWIPADLWLNRSLSIQEKVMLIEIDSLSKDPERGCYKKNQGFAEFFGLSKNRVSEIIKSLESKGFIRIRYQKKGKEIVERNIFIIAPFDKPTPPSEKCDTPFGKAGHPHSENREERGSYSRGSVEGFITPPTGVTAPEGADSVCSLCLGYQWTHGNQCERCQGTGKEPTCNDGLQVVNYDLTTEPPKADKPKPKTKAEKLADLITSKPELLPCLNCLDSELLAEWCGIRVKTKASDSDRALKAIDNALNDLRTLHRVAPDTAIALACDKGWKGLQVEWVMNSLSGANTRQSQQSGPNPNASWDIMDAFDPEKL